MKLNNTRFFKPLFLFLCVFALFSCKSHYTLQGFSFPPGSKAHENNWEYYGKVIVTCYEKKFTNKNEKTVEIKINDREKKLLLEDKFKFDAASIEAKVEWEKFEEITVELLEEGNQFSEDEYNKQLLKNGPKSLRKLKYIYNPTKKLFEREGIG
ncbi:hypothetical protein KA996_11455 [bacterium]|nr:hypothetical protein [bacterium]